MKYSSNPKHADNSLLKMSFSFAIDIARYAENLEERKKWTLANQLFRSGTSIGANAREAQNAESRVDFIHKLKIALKKQKRQSTGFFFVLNCLTTLKQKVFWQK